MFVLAAVAVTVSARGQEGCCKRYSKGEHGLKCCFRYFESNPGECVVDATHLGDMVQFYPKRKCEEVRAEVDKEIRDVLVARLCVLPHDAPCPEGRSLPKKEHRWFFKRNVGCIPEDTECKDSLDLSVPDDKPGKVPLRNQFHSAVACMAYCGHAHFEKLEMEEAAKADLAKRGGKN